MRAETMSQAEADRAFEDDKAIGVLVIPIGFQAAALNGQPIDLNLKAANDNRSLAVEQDVRSIMEQTGGAILAARAAVSEAERIKPFADEPAKQAYFAASLKTAQGLLKNPPARHRSHAASDDCDDSIRRGFCAIVAGAVGDVGDDDVV